MKLLVAAAADSGTGRLVLAVARRRGHAVRALRALDDRDAIAGAVRGADAVVLVPRPGNPERHAHAAGRTLTAAATALAPAAHLLLVSSFAVGYGRAHPLNRVTGSWPARLRAEQALRASGLPYTIVRPTWLTSDPAGAHAVVLTQDARADGMLARADLAMALVAAIEEPEARGRTFALFNAPGHPPDAWAPLFAALDPDRRPLPA